MKRMKKFFVLLSVLFAGFSYKGANDANKMAVADAAEVGSYAYLDSMWATQILIVQITQKIERKSFKNLLITNDGSKVPTSGYRWMPNRSRTY